MNSKVKNLNLFIRKFKQKSSYHKNIQWNIQVISIKYNFNDIYCKPTFNREREKLLRIARASSSQIFLVAN